MRIPHDYKPVKGHYNLREQIKELGGIWDRDTSLWWVPPEKLAEAERLLDRARRYG